MKSRARTHPHLYTHSTHIHTPRASLDTRSRAYLKGWPPFCAAAAHAVRRCSSLCSVCVRMYVCKYMCVYVSVCQGIMACNDCNVKLSQLFHSSAKHQHSGSHIHSRSQSNNNERAENLEKSAVLQQAACQLSCCRRLCLRQTPTQFPASPTAESGTRHSASCH